jgi:putative ABC transport system substrate-binding protein
MRRRDLIALLGGAAMARPLTAHAQPAGRIRQIGVLMGAQRIAPYSDYLAPFVRRLDELGWAEGSTVHIEVRWWDGDPEQLRRGATELLALKPDVVVTYSNFALAAIRPLLGAVPAVFTAVGDPVGSGFVTSLAHPGGNITGFPSVEPAMGGKWVELLREAVPGINRVLALYEPGNPANEGMWGSIQQAAARFGIEAVGGGVHDAGEIERAVSAFAALPGGGVIDVPSATTNVNDGLILSLERRYRLPVASISIQGGHLLGYGSGNADGMRRAAEYVDRILRGAKPADLPVQEPTKFILTVNLKTAKAIGLIIPESFLLLADQVIE